MDGLDILKVVVGLFKNKRYTKLYTRYTHLTIVSVNKRLDNLFVFMF